MAFISPSKPYKWTYVKLGSDFTVNTTANNNVPNFKFTPDANKVYEIEAMYLLQTSVTTTGARPGISFPTGYLDGAAQTDSPNTAAAFNTRFHNPDSGTENVNATGLPVINRSYLGSMKCLLVMGASPSGDFQITLASEIAASDVKMMANSFLRYREI